MPGTVLQECRVFKRCQNIPTGHCIAGCLSGVEAYLSGNVLQGCRLFKWCLKLPARHSVAGVLAAEAVLEPTCPTLCFREAGCLSGVGTYLPGTVLQGCRLFKWCLNLPASYCVAGVHAV